MPFGGLLTVGAITAGGSIISSLFGSSAAKKAAQQKAQADQAALDFQKQVWQQQQQNMQPYQEAGASSLGMLMDALKSGKFDAGKFTLPSIEEARNSPGYQFALEQGNKGIMQGAAASGGVGGQTYKNLMKFGTGLADTTYGNVVNRNLSAYQANMQNNAQQYQELFAPAQLGENAVAGINNTGSGVAQNTGNIMQQQGADLASGTIGSANSIAGGINGASNGISMAVLMNQLSKMKNVIGGGSGGGNHPLSGDFGGDF